MSPADLDDPAANLPVNAFAEHPDPLAASVARAGLPSEITGTLSSWLMGCFQSDVYAGLEQGGDGAERRVPLASVLVDLDSTGSPTREPLEPFEPEGRVLRHLLGLRARPMISPRMVDAPAALSETPTSTNGVVLIGGPGQGKTTLGQLACQLFRAALLGPRAFGLTDEQRASLQRFRDDIRQMGGLTFPESGYLPVHIVLRELSAWLAARKPEASTALFRFLAEAISKRQTTTVDERQLQSLLAVHPWFLVLDGLDEVPRTGGREDIVRAIEGAVRALSDANARGIIVGTTRPQGYADELAKLCLRPLFLAPMSLTRALDYAGRLTRARYAHDADKAERTLERVREASREETVARLLQTPLHVTILTLLVAKLGRAPAERWQLFSRYYSIIYDREVERGGAVAEALSTHRRHIDQAHRRAGLLLQTAAENEETPDATLTRAQLTAIIEQVLVEAGFKKASIQHLVDTLLHGTSERLVFLAEHEEGRYRFDLRSLQEMMAAWEVVHKSPEIAEQRLHTLVPIPSFRNVLLLAASREFSETSDLQSFFVKLCERWNQKETHPLSPWTLIGSRLALDLLEEGSVLGHPLHATRLSEIAARLVKLPPDEVHARLADLRNEHTEDSIRRAVEDALPEVEAGSTSVAIDGSWIVAACLAEEDVEWARGAADRWWALRARRVGLLSVLTTNRIGVGPWLQERVLASLDVLPPGCISGILSLSSWQEGSLALAVARLLCDTEILASSSVPVTTRSGLVVATSALRGHVVPDSRLRAGLRQLALLTTAPPAWRPWVACARYLQSPSKDALAAALRFVAEGFEPTTGSTSALHLSWPLGASLRVATSAEHLLQLAEDVAQGRLGDAADWEAGGVVSLDELTGTKALLPWTLEDGQLTFPARVGSAGKPVRWEEENSAAAISVELADAFDRAESLETRAFLAELLWSHLTTCAAAHVSMPAEILSPVRWDAWARATTGMVSLGALALLAPLHHSGAPEKIRPFRAALRSMGRVDYRSNKFDVARDASDVVLWHLNDDASDHELWSLLFSLRDHDMDSARASLRAVEYSGADPVTLAFARASRLCLGLMPAEEVPEAVSTITATSPLRAQPVVALLGHEGLAATPLSTQEQGLGSLYGTLPPERWYLRWWTMRSMINIVPRRAERLIEPDTWDRLAFPLPRPSDLFRKTPSAPPAPPSPRIVTIALEDLRLFRRFALHASPRETDAGQWLILLGPNGTGKTTLLRALALAMGDPDIVASLVRKPPRWLPTGEASLGTCTVHTLDGDFAFEIEAEEYAPERLRATSRSDGGAPPKPLVYGYGCRRGSATTGQSRPLQWDPLAQVATLFDEEATLVHAETWLQWLKAAAESQGRPEYYRQIERIVLGVLTSLLPGVETIDLVEGRLWFKGPAVGRVHLNGLSDGYLTMIGWIVDLLARWIERATRRNETVPADFHHQMTGLVLLDEIDLHLHPRWQCEIIRNVRDIFPRMTFVVTTHNPLTILGAREGEIFVLRRRDASVTVEQVSLRKGAHADEILTGPWFGLESTVDFETRKLLEEHRRLLGIRRRSPEQETRREGLESTLRERLLTMQGHISLKQPFVPLKSGAQGPSMFEAAQVEAPAMTRNVPVDHRVNAEICRCSDLGHRTGFRRRS